MKKIILLLSILVIGLTGLTINAYNDYRQSFLDVTFSVDEESTSTKIRNLNSEELVFEFKGMEKKSSLRPGQYSYTTTGDGFSESTGEFTISEANQKISITVNYSEQRLSDILQEEEKKIHSVIRNNYPEQLKDFLVRPGTLYKKGDWYGTLLTPNIDPNDIGDYYRIVLHKTDGDWNIIRFPELVLSSKNYPNVPTEVVNQINTLAP